MGKNLLKKSGWKEGSGLGKDQDGTTTHIKVSRKDDVMGIGYKAGVAETWSTQSVGFADVLERIKQRTAAVHNGSDDDGDSGEGSPVSPSASSPSTSKPSSPTESRHYRMYAKRNALKTELLRATDSREKAEEILGRAATHRRGRTSDEEDGDGDARTSQRSRKAEDDDVRSTLKSPLLSRLMVRCPKHEPRPTTAQDGEGAVEERVKVTKPCPRPPRCTDTPFLLHSGGSCV